MRTNESLTDIVGSRDYNDRGKFCVAIDLQSVEKRAPGGLVAAPAAALVAPSRLNMQSYHSAVKTCFHRGDRRPTAAGRPIPSVALIRGPLSSRTHYLFAINSVNMNCIAICKSIRKLTICDADCPVFADDRGRAAVNLRKRKR
jgi:hypothetical protein